jgi:AraC-like DNA-binding protein/quercetin dioxygenase-like cupin family protein
MSNLERWFMRPNALGSCRAEEAAIPPDAAGVITLQQGSGASHERHRHQAMELCVVVAGHGSVEICDTACTLVSGSLLWVLPDQPHRSAEQSADLEMWVVSFNASLLDGPSDWAPCWTTMRYQGQCHAIGWRDLHWLDEELERVCAARTPDLLNAGLAYCVLGAWDAFTHSRAQATRSTEVDRALHLVEDHPELDYQEIAEHVGWSTKRLARTFQREIGVTLRSYQNHVRLDRFTELIEAGNTSCLDACFLAGFGSYAQCHRLFTQRMRCSPRDYARSGRALGFDSPIKAQSEHPAPGRDGQARDDPAEGVERGTRYCQSGSGTARWDH